MIKEIKRQRELLRFSKFVSELSCHNSSKFSAYYHKSPMYFIFTIEILTNNIIIMRNNILEFFGESLSEHDIILCLSKMFTINEISIT